MALVRKTLIDQIEVLANGVLQVRLNKCIVDDATDAILAAQYHRTVIEPGTDPAAQMEAVNQHLRLMNEEPLGAESIARISRLAAVEHTQKVVAAHVARLAAMAIDQPAAALANRVRGNGS